MQKRINRDLKTRCENYQAKLEIAKFELSEMAREHRSALAARDGVIDILKRDNDMLTNGNLRLKEK